MRKDRIDNFNLGLCPKCMERVFRPKNGGICVCKCGEHFNFNIAFILHEEAKFQGEKSLLERIIEIVPSTIVTTHGRAGIANTELKGFLKLKDVVASLSLFHAVMVEGAEIVKELILAKQIEILKKHKIEISQSDAATIIAFKNTMRPYEADEGDLTQNIEVQNLNELEKNKAGEFALSFRDINKNWIKGNVEYSDSLSVCQPGVVVRYEKEGDYVYAYIKSDLDIFAVAHININFPGGSKIFIFHRGVIAN